MHPEHAEKGRIIFDEGSYHRADAAFRDPGSDGLTKLKLLARLFLLEAAQDEDPALMQRFLEQIHGLPDRNPQEAETIAGELLSAACERFGKDAGFYESRLERARTASAREHANPGKRQASAGMVMALAAFLAVTVFAVATTAAEVRETADHYERGAVMYEQGDYSAAAAEFGSAGNWKDAKELREESLRLAADPEGRP